MNKIIVLLSTLFLCSGCSTLLVWEKNGTYEVVSETKAEASQIYIDYVTLSGCSSPTYYIPYKFVDRNKKSFPVNNSGIMVIGRNKCTNYIVKNEDFSNVVTNIGEENIKIVSIKATRYIDKGYALIVSFNASDNKEEQDYLSNRTMKWYKKQMLSTFPKYRLSEIDEEKLIHNYGLIATAYHNDYETDSDVFIEFNDNVDLSRLKPVFQQYDKVYPVDFVQKKYTDYKYPATTRAIFTPFTVAMDILTSPFQLVLITIVGIIGFPT